MAQAQTRQAVQAALHLIAGALRLALAAWLLVAPSAHAQSDAEIAPPPDGGLVCLDGAARDAALSIDLISRAPTPICAPQQRVVEVRNRADAPLGAIQLRLGAPVGPDSRGRDRLTLAPLREDRLRTATLYGDSGPFFEISADDGVTWAPVALPTGRGSDADPFVFTVDEAPALNRLGPAGADDDSLLLRWRAAAGAAYAGAMAFEPEVFLSASAADACGRRISALDRRVALSLTQPALGASIVGRNATRGGGFGRRVTSAPQDVVEWRIEVENAGEAPSAAARIDITAGERLSPEMARLGMTGAGAGRNLAFPDPMMARRPLSGLIQRLDGGGERRAGARIDLGAILAGGRRTVLLRETVQSFCGARAIFAAPSWSCSAEDDGPGAAPSPEWAAGRALLETAPDPARIRIVQTVRGVDGRLAPGDLAEVVAQVANAGAPAFGPRLAVDLPDGYEIDLTVEPVFVDADGNRRLARIDASDPTAPVFDMAAGLSAPGLAPADSADAAGAALDTDRPVSITYRIRRTRPSLMAADDLVSTLLYQDACGTADSSRSARTRVAARRAELTATIEPERDGLAPGPGEIKRIGVVIGNRGLEDADAVRIRLGLGAAWGRLRDERCRFEGAAGGQSRYVCAVPGGAPPGSSQRLSFELRAADALWTPDPAGADLPADAPPPFGIRADVEALRAAGLENEATAAGPAETDVVARASAQTALLGFRLTQRLLTDAGAPRAEQTLELGERALLEVEALWYGAPLDRLTTASLTQSPPASLAFRTVRSAAVTAIGRRLGGDWPSERPAEARLTPAVGANGPIYWTVPLPDEAGDAAALQARFVGRIEVEAVDPRLGAGAPGARGAEDIATVASVFLYDGVAFGVDAAGGETTAAALPISVRRPGVSLSVVLETADGAALPRDVWGRHLVSPAGPGPRARFRVENAGAGPVYLDWAAIEARPGLSFAPLGRDGVDNDGDGSVDEADESTSATSERRAGGATLRWLATPASSDSRRTGAAGLGSAAQRIDPGATAEWTVALVVEPDSPPGSDLSLGLSGRFGALPFAETGGTARVVVQEEVLAATEGVAGFLTLVDASRAGVLSRRVTHGEQVTHRARITAPAGRVANLELIVDMPPAFTAIEPLARSIGPAFDCVDWAPPGVEQRAIEDAGDGPGLLVWRLVWRLGDCTIAPGPEGVRSAFLDISAVAQDADPTAPPAARRAWRVAETAAWARYFGRGRDGGRTVRLEALGRERLRVVGPLLALRVAEPLFVGGAPDAGDAGEARIEIENVGDQVAEFVSLRLEADRGGPLDCPTLGLQAPLGGFDPLRRDETSCAVEALSSAGAPIAPGDRVNLSALLSLAASAPIGSEVGADVRLSSATGPDGAMQFFRPARARLAAPGAAADAPELRARIAGAAPMRAGDALARAGFGDRVRASAVVALPEGVAAGEIVVRLRALTPGDQGAPGAALPAEALALALRGLRASLFVDGRPLNAPLGGAQGLVVRAEPDGWLALARPFEALAIGPAAASPRKRRLSLVADFAVGASAVADAETPPGFGADPADAQALEALWRDGAQLEAAAALRLTGHGGPDFEAISPERAVFALAEPQLDAVALIESGVFASAPGASAIARFDRRVTETATSSEAMGRWSDGGEIGPGELARFVARICNRGGAPAYDVTVLASLPDGFAPLSTSGDEDVRRSGLFARGDAVWRGARLEARSAPNAALEPGGCATVSTLARATPDLLAGAPSAFEVAVASARAGRGGDPGLRRVYRNLASAQAAPRRVDLQLEGPRQAAIAPGGPALLPFAVSAPAVFQSLNVRVDIESLGEPALDWTIFEDRDRDGAVGPADTPILEAIALPPGARLALVAQARAPEAFPADWRGLASFRVSAAAAQSAGPPVALFSERAVALSPAAPGAAPPAPTIATRRLMALDRDCDGSLVDEAAQDAAYEVSKTADPGDCVHFRVVFVNRGEGPVIDVTLEETPPTAAELARGSLAFQRTPPGLVAGRAEIVGAAPRERLVFRFVGALAPGRRGWIGYRMRVPG